MVLDCIYCLSYFVLQAQKGQCSGALKVEIICSMYYWHKLGSVLIQVQ